MRAESKAGSRQDKTAEVGRSREAAGEIRDRELTKLHRKQRKLQNKET